MNIRLLKASEIECRVQSTKKTKTGVGCILLLYKDARVDMKLLDEIYGEMGWQRTHEVINGNLFCNIEIWDKDKNCWIKKQDVGTESNTEKEKGQASDSFKRAGFNWGIGRELYTAPFIWIELQNNEWQESNNKVSVSPYVKFKIKNIGYNEDREINQLEIVDSKNIVRYSLGGHVKPIEKGNTNTSTTPKQTTTDDILQCTECHKKITIAVHDFSVKRFGKQLCPVCQNKYKTA